MAARSLGKNLQDQQVAVVDRKLQHAFEVALLRRAQRLIEQYLHSSGLGRQGFDFVGFALAYEQRRVRRLALAGDAGHWLQARCLRKQAQLI